MNPSKLRGGIHETDGGRIAETCSQGQRRTIIRYSQRFRWATRAERGEPSEAISYGSEGKPCESVLE